MMAAHGDENQDERMGRRMFLWLGLPLLIWSCSHDPGVGDMSAGSDTFESRDTGGAVCTRQVLIEEVVNARDIGGQALAQSRRVACGQILRGGDLCRLSAAGCSEFTALGIKTVIDLRAAQTQQASPAASCVTDRTAAVSGALPKLLPDTPDNYLALMQEKDAIAAVFAALGDPQNYPVYIHCVIGRDRASFIPALVLLTLGADRQTVIDEFNLSGAAGITVKEPCITAILDEVEHQGGIEAFLESCGVTSTQLENLRTQVQMN